MLIDTHCHIHDVDTYNFALSRQQISKKFLAKNPNFPHLPEDFTPDKILDRAMKADVRQVICVGTSHEDSLKARDFAEKHPGVVFWSYGIHPDEASEALSRDFGAIAPSEPESSQAVGVGCPHLVRSRREQARERASETSSLVAIGEVGLDYHHGTAHRTAQIKLFERMLDLAQSRNLPLIFHIREAFDDFFAVIQNFPNITGVVHSFSDSEQNLKKSLKFGFFIGVNGLVTFSPTPVPPLEKILLETDAPFLTPEPFRGTINEAARIRDICAYLSRVKGVSEQEMAQITTENARKLFRLQHAVV